jgi:hypothetical protein
LQKGFFDKKGTHTLYELFPLVKQKGTALFFILALSSAFLSAGLSLPSHKKGRG